METARMDAAAIADNFADLHPNYLRDEAVAEASRCLYCHDAPCMRACPTHIDIPRFIRQILHSNVRGAAETIFDANILGGSCARACPTEVLCEGACVEQARSGNPVQIGRLQRFATDYAMDRGLTFFEPGAPTGMKVAVIGSGPAGIACAHELRRQGHAVTMFEARDVPGGLNTMGIAAYKITREFSLREIEHAFSIGGIDLKLNSRVDAAKLKSLIAEYDAVFLGVGLGETQRLGLPGEDGKGVWEGLAFIYEMHTGKPFAQVPVGREVIVIGCGNTAIDSATAAVRLGAEKVTIAYRRGPDEMSAYVYEYELAKADGCRFEWFASPVEFLHADGKLTGVKFVRTRLVGEGRTAKLETVAGSEFVVPCDMAIKALGQSPVLELLSAIEGVKFGKNGVEIDRSTFATSLPGLFAGGDCTHKGKEIVNAVEDGKQAARSIDAYLAAKGAKK